MSNKEKEGDTTPKDTQMRVSEKVQAKAKKQILDKAKDLKQLKVEYVPLDSIKPNNYNPNRQSDHEFELLLRSMAEDGFTQPILITPDNTIVDGEHRWRGAKTLGIDPIPVVRVNMTPEQMKVSTLRHNRARGSEELTLVSKVLKDLESLGQLDYAKDELMLTDIEINRILEDVPVSEAIGMVPEYQEPWTPDNKEGTGFNQSMTAEATEKLREAERRIERAKTEEDRQQAIRERDTYKLSLVFSGEEAKIVKEILGDSPADTFLKMCQYWKENNL